MFEGIFNQNLIIREWLNGALIPLSLNLSIVIAVYLVQSFSEARRSGTRVDCIPGINTARALLFVFSGETIRAMFVWLTLRAVNDGHALPTWTTDLANVMLVFAAIVLVFAVLRCTYIFTPPGFRTIIWISSLALTVIFLTLSHLFPRFPFYPQ